VRTITYQLHDTPKSFFSAEFPYANPGNPIKVFAITH